MSLTLFLRLDGVPGDATVRGHEGWIEVQSVAWGLTSLSTTPGRTAGAGAGRTAAHRAQAIGATFTALVGPASPLLMAACAAGQQLRNGRFEARKNGDTPVTIVRLDLEDLAITAYSLAGTVADSTLLDTFEVTAQRVRETTVSSSLHGGTGVSSDRGWDFAANRPW